MGKRFSSNVYDHPAVASTQTAIHARERYVLSQPQSDCNTLVEGPRMHGKAANIDHTPNLTAAASVQWGMRG